MSRLLCFSSVFALFCAGCCARAEPEVSPDTSAAIDQAVEQGVRFLLSRQDADGAWRSTQYGTFKDPTALTPLVADALARSRLPQAVSACAAGARLLAKWAPRDGSDVPDFSYPIYTAGFAIDFLCADLDRQEAAQISRWARFLAARQMSEELGWSPDDPSYGGWGYAKDLPRKPLPPLRLLPVAESNLSATAFVLTALRQAGHKPEEPLFRKALVFLGRCQNWSEKPRTPESAFDDGGFFFIPNDPTRNKAGQTGTESDGGPRYASYGSATADGLRALAACGVSEEDPRLRAARTWLLNNYRPDRHPGSYNADREENRSGLYFYYAFSVSRALGSEVEDQERRASLIRVLLKRQQKDGSWSNPNLTMREDDALVATSFSLLAIAACR